MKKIIVPIDEALGLPLSHDLTMIDPPKGFKGPRFRRGHVVAPEDLDVLRSMGRQNLTILQLEADEVHEDEAAEALAEKLCGTGLSFTKASEGKCELVAAHDGLWSYDVEAVHAVNEDPRWCLTLQWPFTAAQKGDVLGALRILPLSIDNQGMTRALDVARPLSVLPFGNKRVAVVTTGRELAEGLVADAFLPRLKERLAPYGAVVEAQTFPGDDVAQITRDLKSFVDQSYDLVTASGGMSVDADDVTPQALAQVADEVLFQGVPIIPGCNLMVGRAGTSVLLGVPAGSIFVPFSSMDILLPRILAGLVPDGAEIRRWGVGGFCGATKTFPGGGARLRSR